MTNHTAIVTMFNRRRRCRVVAYGEPKLTKEL